MLSLVVPVVLAQAADDQIYDLVIYGQTSAGVAAAVQAKRMGRTVILVGPDKHLGGLSSGGLGWTDSGDKRVIGGIAREFYQRVHDRYENPESWRWQKVDDYAKFNSQADAQWTFEPHVAEQVFEDLIAEEGIKVVRDEWLDRAPGAGVRKEGGRITSITMLSGASYRGRMFIDATYEGDLMAAAGVAFAVGRESNSQYGETLNGIQRRKAVYHQFPDNVDPYVVPGDPASGLLPLIMEGNPGEEGSGDRRMQAYNYRLCLTKEPENRVEFPKPENYDAGKYELLLRLLKVQPSALLCTFNLVPNLKTDTNNNGPFSTDNIGKNYDYPTASYDRRLEIAEEHRQYQQGLFWFLANDPRVPQAVRDKIGVWGLAKDEFQDNDNWPHQMYVREARRMIGELVIDENHLIGKKPTYRPIAMGSYNIDSHNVLRYVDSRGFVKNEGDVQVSPGGAYPIDYGAIVPAREECQNLLVPVCVSSTHIAFGSIRMEPVFMALGQSAATAASLSLDADVAVQDLSYLKLKERLESDGQVLTKPPQANVIENLKLTAAIGAGALTLTSALLSFGGANSSPKRAF